MNKSTKREILAEVWNLINGTETCPLDALQTVAERRGLDVQTAAQIAKSDTILMSAITTRAASLRSIVVNESPLTGPTV